MGDVEPLLAHLATGCGECLRDAFPGTPPPLDHVRPRTTTTAARGRLVVSGALASATLVALATSGFVHLQRSRAAPRAGLTQTLSRIDALETDKRRLADRLGEAARELTTLRTAPPAERPAVIEPPPAPAAAAEPEDPTPIVRYGDDRLSVRLVDVPPMRILEELARGTDAVVRGRVAEAPPVSARFDDVPLPEALHRLLGRQNFTLAYDGRHRLRAVTLLGGPVETTRDEQADVGSVDAAAERPAADLSRVLNWRLSVPAHGRLAWTLGVRTLRVEAEPTNLAGPPWPNVILQTRAQSKSTLLPTPAQIIAWEHAGAHYTLLAHVRTFRVFSTCAPKGTS